MAGQSKSKSPYEFIKFVPGRFERLQYRTYNWFENRLWPIRPTPFAGLCLAGVALQTQYFNNVEFCAENYLKIIHAILISVGATYGATFLFRQLLKYCYFSYKGFLFENPKNPSIKTKLWAATRHILAKFAKPQLSSCDSLLPKMPLPKLADSVHAYIASMKHLISQNEYEELQTMGDEFLKNEGWKLQAAAWVWHKCTENYVTPIWEKFIYNAGRYPLLINSSVAQCTMYGKSGNLQAYQAARIIYIETIANLCVDQQKYMAPGGGLMSTRHYRNMYNGCRIPGEKYDHFQWNPPAKHVILIRAGTLYKMDICDEKNRIFTIDEMAKIITEMLGRDDISTGSLSKIASLTHDARTEWWRNRKKFFVGVPKNRQLLDMIETAAFVMSIDDDLEWDVETPDRLSKYMKDMLAGSGMNRWVDKTMNYAVDSTGRAGATGEHSPCDGAELDHLCENVLKCDRDILPMLSIDEQQKVVKLTDEERGTLKLVEKLDFELVDGMEHEIERCYKAHIQATNNLDLYSLAFLDFGKGLIKKCGISPDGFLQMAIQLASYQENQGKFVLTYEPGAVRSFANSRTETVRPVTDASCKFVTSMFDDDVTKEERCRLLREACDVHVNNCKNVLVGNGFDRHLFVLCVIAKAFGYESKFLEHFASQKWILSTSNIPNMTNSIDEDKSVDSICIGASFGAVAENGYGICYRFAGNQAIMVHITSYHSSENTNSARFAQLLKDAFYSLADLFDNSKNNNDTK
ncbi:unnamed protein product [Caenorhabditis bovis]|uniref:Choline/carnitine acyltransferase domain-containing protein n=1 Tax=Caenorhabditis bovis TaxID=2654633 RepID=A0A8S1E9H7_9PELO|nr:unnamed protein product [Caenorhabditis bovis]